MKKNCNFKQASDFIAKLIKNKIFYVPSLGKISSWKKLVIKKLVKKFFYKLCLHFSAMNSFFLIILEVLCLESFLILNFCCFLTVRLSKKFSSEIFRQNRVSGDIANSFSCRKFLQTKYLITREGF